MTQKQLDALKEKYSMDDIDRLLDKLSEYKEEKGQEYASDYKATKSWVERWLGNEKGKEQSRDKTFGKNLKSAIELQKYLETNGVRGDFYIGKDYVEDKLFNKTHSLYSAVFEKAVFGWYKLEVDHED
jgi:hypothetical protein